MRSMTICRRGDSFQRSRAAHGGIALPVHGALEAEAVDREGDQHGAHSKQSRLGLSSDVSSSSFDTKVGED
jgi:hypothetical protein